MGINLDTTGQTFPAVTSGSTITVTGYSTNFANEVLVAFILFTTTTASQTISNFTGGGLTWHFRGRVYANGNPDSGVEEWYAVAPSPLSSVTLTATSSGTLTFGAISVFSVSGADTSTIFDSHAGLPVTLNTNPSDPINISTSNAGNDFVFAAIFPNITTPKPGPSWGQILSGQFTLLEHQIVTGAQTSLSATIAPPAAGSTSMAMADAIIEAAGTTPKQIWLTNTSLTNWTVPGDWNSSNNSVECIGGGGGAAGSCNNQTTGGAGGGAAYAKSTNLTLTPGNSVSINIGTGGSGGAGVASGTGNPGTAGGDTCFGGTTLGACTVGAQGGQGGGAASGGGSGAVGAGGAAASSVGGTKFSGGAGGGGSGITQGGGGGGGAAGPHGGGSIGGTLNNAGGCGGGGNGGGSSTGGGTSSGSTGGNGGTAEDGTAGGAGASSLVFGTPGINGAGGGGGFGNTAGTGGGAGTTGGAGGTGNDFDSANGSGGGGGGGGSSQASSSNLPGNGAVGGAYGGGGGSGGANMDGTTAGGNGGAGWQGIIVITYTPVTATIQATWGEVVLGG